MNAKKQLKHIKQVRNNLSKHHVLRQMVKTHVSFESWELSMYHFPQLIKFIKNQLMGDCASLVTEIINHGGTMYLEVSKETAADQVIKVRWLSSQGTVIKEKQFVVEKAHV